eukprot:COSAG01_NODE_1728_length_9373_cov_25.243476_6_plen_84_part_00
MQEVSKLEDAKAAREGVETLSAPQIREEATAVCGTTGGEPMSYRKVITERSFEKDYMYRPMLLSICAFLLKVFTDSQSLESKP